MHDRRDGSQKRGCSPLQASTQHEEGKLEHFDAFLPWVMSKLCSSEMALPSPGRASRHAGALAASRGIKQGRDPR